MSYVENLSGEEYNILMERAHYEDLRFDGPHGKEFISAVEVYEYRPSGGWSGYYNLDGTTFFVPNVLHCPWYPTAGPNF